MIQFDSLEAWLEWLEASHPTTEIELGLARVSKVAKLLQLDKPQVPVITVAGTNGKGSVVATLESLACNHNLQVGSYTSPHLLKFNERVKINGTPVSDELLCQAFFKIANSKGDIPLTYFEYTTLVGLYCFQQQALDFIVLEVGLGGRLDAVNLVDTDIAIITSIGLDHTDWLGETLEEIAYEKAGVARKNKPLVVADKSLLPLLDKAINDIQPNLVVESYDYFIEADEQQWSYRSSSLKLTNLVNNSLFVTNKAAALTAFIEVFPEIAQSDSVSKALNNAGLTGRFSQLSEDPWIILDVAHNPDSAQLLNKNLKELDVKADQQIWAICGMLKDKDIEASLNQMDQIDQWLCIDLNSPRGSEACYLESIISTSNPKSNYYSFSNIETAYRFFIDNASEVDLLVVFGSFVTVGQMLEYWHKA